MPKLKGSASNSLHACESAYLALLINTASLVLDVRLTAKSFASDDKEKSEINWEVNFVSGFAGEPLSGNDQRFPTSPTVLI